MFAHEMFKKMPADLGSSIVGWLRDSERDVFRTALHSLAQQKKLRPVFVTRKSKPEQAAWFIEQLKLRGNEAVGENLLQIWLMKGRSDMLSTFLDAVGVKHDGKGGVDGDIPNTFDPAKVKAGAAALLEKFPAGEVAVYLNLFQLQQPGGWKEIADTIAADARLQIGG
jgi:hypothetical protein